MKINESEQIHTIIFKTIKSKHKKPLVRNQPTITKVYSHTHTALYPSAQVLTWLACVAHSTIHYERFKILLLTQKTPFNMDTSIIQGASPTLVLRIYIFAWILFDLVCVYLRKSQYILVDLYYASLRY